VNDSSKPRTAQLSLSWPRRQWLKFVAVLQDHPLPTLSLAALALFFLLFYATRLHGWSHFTESFARWRVDTFGGAHSVSRSIRLPDVLLSFKANQHDRLDVLAPTSIHLGANAFRQELHEIIARGGSIRIVTLDPRLADPSHAYHARYLELAEAFGQAPGEFAARTRYGAATLARLAAELGPACQVRFLAQPLPDTAPPYFTLGRCANSYSAGDPANRFDVIVPRPDQPTGSDSFTHPAAVIVKRPGNPDVVLFSAAFEAAWALSQPLGEWLESSLLNSPHAPTTQGNQP